MKYTQTNSAAYSLVALKATKTRIVQAVISVDTLSKKTTQTQATDLVYDDGLLAGCAHLKRAEFLDAISTLGASISVHSGTGVTEIHLRATEDVFPKLLKLTEHMLAKPAFLNKEINRAVTVICNTLEEAKESERLASHQSLKNALYGPGTRHSSSSLNAIANSVKEITAVDLRKKHSDVSNNYWTCTIVGNAKSIKVFTDFLDAFKKKAADTSAKEVTHIPSKQNLLLTNIPSKQNIDFSIGAPLPFALKSSEYAAVRLGISVLGRPGFAGRLMSTVREKEGLTYSCYAYSTGFYQDEPGYWRVWTFFSPDKAQQGLTSVFREVKKLYTKGITDAELEQFKLFFRTDETMRQDSILSQFSHLHALHKQGLTVVDADKIQNDIQSLTTEEVNAAIKKYFNPKTLIISGAGPIKAVQKELQEFAKSVS